MSYILEALKKSEARRRDGQAPDLTQTPLQTARRPGRWPLLLLTVLVLGAGSALGVWLAANRDADSTEMVQDTGPAQSAATGTGETGTQTTDPADQPTTHVAIADRVRRAAGRSRPEPAAPQDDGNLTQPAPDTTRDTTTDTTAEPTAGVLATGSAVAGTEAEPGIDVAQDPPPQELPEVSTGTVADAASPPNPLDELTARAGEYLEPRSEPETAEPEPIEPGPPLIHELGWTFRSQLPQLALNVHMYSEDPAQRFVLINMRRYQEGDVMENSGIVIQQVVAEGVILNHAGRDFLLGR